VGAKEQSGRTWPSIFWARGTVSISMLVHTYGQGHALNAADKILEYFFPETLNKCFISLNIINLCIAFCSARVARISRKELYNLLIFLYDICKCVPLKNLFTGTILYFEMEIFFCAQCASYVVCKNEYLHAN
jgi:hypothetical protein